MHTDPKQRKPYFYFITHRPDLMAAEAELGVLELYANVAQAAELDGVCRGHR